MILLCITMPAFEHPVSHWERHCLSASNGHYCIPVEPFLDWSIGWGEKIPETVILSISCFDQTTVRNPNSICFMLNKPENSSKMSHNQDISFHKLLKQLPKFEYFWFIKKKYIYLVFVLWGTASMIFDWSDGLTHYWPTGMKENFLCPLAVTHNDKTIWNNSM